MGRHRGKPGLGTKTLSPGSHITAKMLYRAPEQPKVRKTSLGVKGCSGFEKASTIASLAWTIPLDWVYPLQVSDLITSQIDSLMTSGRSKPLALLASPVYINQI